MMTEKPIEMPSEKSGAKQKTQAKSADGSLHIGHRQRMKQRVLQYGVDSLADHEVLEVLLYFGLPRGDTNALAHNLIRHFGSLSRVLEADYEDLLQVNGVGENTAFMLSVMPKMFGRFKQDKNRDKLIFGSVEAFGEYVCELFVGEKNEVVYLICLNAGMQLLNSVRLGEGDIGSVAISVQDVVRTALTQKARNVVLAHNHPGGRTKVSVEDFEMTRRCMRALADVNVKLVDHLIVCGDTYCSFAERGYMTLLQENLRREGR